MKTQLAKNKKEAKDIIRKYFEGCQVVKRYIPETRTDGKKIEAKNYDYLILPFEDGKNGMPFSLGYAISFLAFNALERHDYEKIVAPETKGLTIAYPYQNFIAINEERDVPIIPLRKRIYGTSDEIVIVTSTAYGENSKISIRVPEKTKILYIDDVISGGETSIPLLKHIREKCEIIDAFVVMERGPGTKHVKEETGIDVKSLIKIDIIDEKPIIYFIDEIGGKQI